MKSFSELALGEMVHVYPMPGLRVVDGPRGNALPEDGKQVAWSEFWNKRALDGSISLTDPRPKAAAKPAKGEEK